MSETPTIQNQQTPASDLLTPSLGDTAPAAFTGPKPWRLGSQFWIAFLGGVLALTYIAWQNSKRLAMPASRQRLILLVGLIGLIAVWVGTYLQAADQDRIVGTTRSSVRLLGRVIAVVAYLVMYQIQKDADQRYQFRMGSEYASLWRPGFFAVIGLGLLQAAVMVGVVALL